MPAMIETVVNGAVELFLFSLTSLISLFAAVVANAASLVTVT